MRDSILADHTSDPFGKKVRVYIQHLGADFMSEAVDDLVGVIKKAGHEVGFDDIEIEVERETTWDQASTLVQVHTCFGCHIEIGKGHTATCPVAGARG